MPEVTEIYKRSVLGIALQRVFCLPSAFAEPPAAAEVLRGIAKFEGGDEVIASAYPAALATAQGIIFDFKTEEQRERFQRRCREFLRDVVLQRLTFDPALPAA